MLTPIYDLLYFSRKNNVKACRLLVDKTSSHYLTKQEIPLTLLLHLVHTKSKIPLVTPRPVFHNKFSWKSGMRKRSSFCGSGSRSAKILPLPLPHRLFDLKSNLAKKFCPFPNVD